MASHGSKEGLDDYWNEFKEIEENKDGEEEEELPKTPDGKSTTWVQNEIQLCIFFIPGLPSVKCKDFQTPFKIVLESSDS